MSEKFEVVKKWYDKGLWDLTKVHNAVGKWITEAEYKEITGDEYTE